MRLQAKKPVKIRGRILGGIKPLICIPLVEERDIEQAAMDAVKLSPDVIEWRADYFCDCCNTARVNEALKNLRSIIGEIPLIFTFRNSLEGRFKRVEDGLRHEIIRQAIYTEKIDALDVELICGKTNIENIKRVCKAHKIPLILSYHNFSETPSVELLLDKIREEVFMGADIAKIAVMPKNEEDILNLFSASLKARTEITDIPLITISMGSLGAISRIAGGLFGSDLTFAAGKKASAPGQFSMEEIRAALKMISCY